MIMKIRTNYSLKKINTFGVDHNAKFFLSINNSDDIINFINYPNYQKEKKLILGGGSNILFTKDFDGVVLYNNIKGIEIIYQDEDKIKLKVGSGESWDDFVSYCVDNKWYGIENLSLIPGSVGAAPIQNIGAYGVEVKNFISQVNGIDLIENQPKKFNQNACNFKYRNSIFKEKLKNNFFVTSVEFELYKKSDFNLSYKDLTHLKTTDLTLLEVRNEIIKIRNKKLPNPKEIGNAGSFFKNPIVNQKTFNNLNNKYHDLVFIKMDNKKYKIPAAWLIEKCGWKGFSDKSVGVYKNHALVLVNNSSNSGQDIKDLSEKIQINVKENFSISLEAEVNII